MNKFITTSLAVALLSGCIQKNPIEDKKDPIEAQKHQIITKMNQVISTKKLEIKNGSECMILVEGVKDNTTVFAGLRCDDGTDINDLYENGNTETYTALVNNIIFKKDKLNSEGACMQMISTDPKNPEGPKRVVESADCPNITA